MNKIAVQTGGPEERLGIDETYRMVKEWGFDAVDANIDHLLSGRSIVEGNIPQALIAGGEDCMALFKPWAEAAKKYGVDNYQAHAPFPSLVHPVGSDINLRMLEVLKNMLRGCDLMDCRNLIIHPFFLGYDKQLSPEDEWNVNIESYAKLIPTAREYGVTVCLENMFTGYRGKIYAACCSDIDQACRMVDELNALAGQRCFGLCLDTGHMLLCGLDAYKTITQLGSRISAFHIHDNDGRNDQHLAPYMGILDWERFIAGVRDIGFDRTLSFETFNVWNSVHGEVMNEMMRFIAACGRMFARRIAES